MSARVAWLLLVFVAVGWTADTTESAAAGGPSLRKITFPGKSWALALDLPGFEFSRRDSRSDGKGISVFGSDDARGMVVTVFIEHAAGPGDARACRDYYLSKGQGGHLHRREVKLSERPGMALVEYYGPRVGIAEIDNQKHVNAYLSHDGLWIDVHLSKMSYGPQDQERFNRILQIGRAHV